MCLSVPFKIIKINGKNGLGEYMGIKKSLRLDFIPQVKVNDYVMVHVGFAMQILDEENYNASINLLKEIQEEAKYD